jgi:hypothetical protein
MGDEANAPALGAPPSPRPEFLRPQFVQICGLFNPQRSMPEGRSFKDLPDFSSTGKRLTTEGPGQGNQAASNILERSRLLPSTSRSPVARAIFEAKLHRELFAEGRTSPASGAARGSATSHSRTYSRMNWQGAPEATASCYSASLGPQKVPQFRPSEYDE